MGQQPGINKYVQLVDKSRLTRRHTASIACQRPPASRRQLPLTHSTTSIDIFDTCSRARPTRTVFKLNERRTRDDRWLEDVELIRISAAFFSFYISVLTHVSPYQSIPYSSLLFEHGPCAVLK